MYLFLIVVHMISWWCVLGWLVFKWPVDDDMTVVVWSCVGIDKHCIGYIGSDPCRYWPWGCSDIYSTPLFSTGRCSRTGVLSECGVLLYCVCCRVYFYPAMRSMGGILRLLSLFCFSFILYGYGFLLLVNKMAQCDAKLQMLTYW